jgi:hypothetical protein
VIGDAPHARSDHAPPDRSFRISRGSGGEEDATVNKVEAGPSIHLALDEFQLVRLSFGSISQFETMLRRCEGV